MVTSVIQNTSSTPLIPNALLENVPPARVARALRPVRRAGARAVEPSNDRFFSRPARDDETIGRAAREVKSKRRDGGRDRIDESRFVS
jgi:hypothetical protein